MTTIISCMMLYQAANRLHSPDAFAAERPSPFISIKSRSIIRLFRKIRYIKHRLLRRWNHIVEKILLYDDGITCILPKDEAYDED